MKGIRLRLATGICLVFWAVLTVPAGAALREENFDREPHNWEGVNNRNHFFEAKTVVQDFGYSPTTSHAGGQPGEVGGRLNPAGEAAYYAFRLPQPLTFGEAMTAEGNVYVDSGAGHFLLGFFNTNALNEWRTPNTLIVRINSRGESSHYHLEYCTARWRANAGVIGHIIPGERITAKEIANGKRYRWKLSYDPAGANGRGQLTFSLNGETASCEIEPNHHADGVTVTHFGLLPIPKTWDSPGEIWIDNLLINGAPFDFDEDPRWDAFHNGRTYTTADTRPKFDFGWSPTHHAGGNKAGELGGLIFRGDCREPSRMACYGDRLAPLTLRMPLEAGGKVVMLRGITDATASIGFYHSVHSMTPNPSQKHSIPMDYLGINIEGPSSEGFFFYPVYRVHGDASRVAADMAKAPRIYPDAKSHDWFLRYDPNAANGNGQITVGLDQQTITLDLQSGHKELGATFDRFGICTPWIDGNSVTAYFDDLAYTATPE